MRRILLSAVAAAVVAAPLAAQKDTLRPMDGLVAIVGDRAILQSDVLEGVFARMQLMQVTKLDTVRARALLDTLVNLMIDNNVLMMKAKEYKIEIPDLVLAQGADERVKAMRAHFPSEAEFQAELARNGIGTPDEYRRFVIEQMRSDTVQRLVMERLHQDSKMIPVNVTDSEVTATYNQAAAAGQLRQRSAMITFRQLVIAPQGSAAAKAVARAIADSLRKEIKNGADFDHVAKRSSMDPATKDAGGLIENIHRGEETPEIDGLLFGPLQLRQGELSGVIESGGAFHVIRKEHITPTAVNIRDLVIRPVVDSNDVIRTGKLADSVAGLVRAGTPFDTLVRHYNDYAGGEDGGLMEPIGVDTLPGTYKTAFADKKAGDVVTFQIPTASGTPKYVVAQVVEVKAPGPESLAELREGVRYNLAQIAGYRRTLDMLRKDMFIRVNWGRIYSIIPLIAQ